MILNAAQRTDIPAFYSPWLARRLREGYVMVRNPYNPQSVTRYRLDPSVVDLMGFCTKNPWPLISYWKDLEPYGQFWYVTVTPYGRDIEPFVPPVERALEGIRELSRRLGPHAVGWRYDPILLTSRYTAEWHIQQFERMAAFLEGYTDAVVISFLDLYKNVRLNFPEARPVPKETQRILARRIIQIAGNHGMVVRPCGEGRWMEVYGADCRGCYTQEIFEKALGEKLKLPPMHTRMRSECTCYLGGDIGAYSSCGHLCRYCYANRSVEAVRRRMRAHDPASPFLIGHSEPGDHVHQAEQKSWIVRQMSLPLK
jgi:hypothetical protein